MKQNIQVFTEPCFVSFCGNPSTVETQVALVCVLRCAHREADRRLSPYSCAHREADRHLSPYSVSAMLLTLFPTLARHPRESFIPQLGACLSPSPLPIVPIPPDPSSLSSIWPPLPCPFPPRMQAAGHSHPPRSHSPSSPSFHSSHSSASKPFPTDSMAGPHLARTWPWHVSSISQVFPPHAPLCVAHPPNV